MFGPFLDRTRGGRRLMVAATMAARAVLCLVMAEHVNGYALYPLAFAALVLSKAQSVTKSALRARRDQGQDELVLANSRLAFISILGGIAAGPVAALILRCRGTRPGCCATAFRGLRPRDARRVRTSPRRAGRRRPRRSTSARRCTRGASSSPARAMGLLRGAVGFFTFFAAFVLKRAHEPAWVFGARAHDERGRQRARHRDRAAAASGAPGKSGSSRARSWFRACRWCSRRAAYGRARARGRGGRDRRPASAAWAGSRSTACCSATARSRRAAARSPRFETRFQLVWVLGGVLAVVFPGGGRGGIFLVALVLLFAGLSYVGAVRRPARPAPRRNPTPRAVRPSRTGGCRSRSDRSPRPSCRPCSRSTSAASARRRARPIAPTAGCSAELDRTQCAFDGGDDGRRARARIRSS